jgi:hypothetical protein
MVEELKQKHPSEIIVCQIGVIQWGDGRIEPVCGGDLRISGNLYMILGDVIKKTLWEEMTKKSPNIITKPGVKL